MRTIRKYPRTPHLKGSRLQAGDEDLDAADWSAVVGHFAVVEEKLDGANAGVRFGPGGELLLQSRGHYLSGGPRERQFAPFKAWAAERTPALYDALGERHVMYGEWLYAKHTIYYDALTGYFHEFDIFDTHTDEFLSTDRRRELLRGTDLLSVPVLWSGVAAAPGDVTRWVGPSLYKTADWRASLAGQAAAHGQDPERIRRETDGSDLMEGLYIKVEEAGRVAGRYKWVRADYLSAIRDSGGHWMRRPILPNRLATAAGSE